MRLMARINTVEAWLSTMQAMARMTKQRLAVIGELTKAGGKVEDKSGRAVALLHAKLGAETSLKALTNALTTMEEQGLVEREIRGKRTYAVILKGTVAQPTTSSPMGEVLASQDGGQGSDVPSPHPGPSQEAEGMGQRDGLDYRLLADALLVRVAEVIDTKSDQAELNQRLANLLADREKFRRQVAEIGEDLAVVKSERDGLRKRLRQAEENIQTMLDPRNKVGLGDRHRRALERFMQARPAVKG
jgi:regulator of replication initiation timing